MSSGSNPFFALNGHANRHGIALIWVAILALILIGLAGLAIDTAFMFVTGHQLQNAADAAALAGANMVLFDQNQAVTDAVNWAGYNRAAGANVQLDSNVDVVLGTYNRSTHIFTAGGGSPNAVKAIARRTAGSPSGPVNLFFGSIFGISTSDVAPRTAIAMSNPLGAGVIILNPTVSGALHFNGSSSAIHINGSNGGIYVDSNSSTAVTWPGNSHPTLSASSLAVAGNDTAVSSIFPSGSTTLNAPVAPDPLAWLPEPPKGTTQNNGNTNNANLQPGYYPSGISGKHTLAAGIYYVDGGISLSGNRSLTATAGCMIFLHTGGISMGGNTSFTINPPTSGTYAGISFYSARGNTSSVTLQGGPSGSSTGTFYFPSAAVHIAGSGNGFATQLICDTLDVQGNVDMVVNYNGGNPIKRHMSFLVQ